MPLLADAIHDTELDVEQLIEHIAVGGRCVRYVICVSFLVGTIHSQSRLRIYSSVNWQYLGAIPALLVCLLFGWWALPWGPILTLRALWININGGLDLTEQLTRELEESGQVEFVR